MQVKQNEFSITIHVRVSTFSEKNMSEEKEKVCKEKLE